MSLFNDLERTDERPHQKTEPLYDFIDRSPWLFVAQVRELTDQWFDHFPDDAKQDLRHRFQSKNDEQHLGAHFELFLHEILLKLGCALEVHPAISGRNTHPDFLVSLGEQRLYVEATVIHSSSEDREVTKHELLILQWIDELDASNFWLCLDAVGTLTTQPKKSDIVPFRNLMAQHRPDDVESDIRMYGRHAAPHSTITIGSWSLSAILLPKPPGIRGERTIKTIAVEPVAGSSLRDVSATVVEKIQRKASQKQVRHLDAPLVIAAKAMDSFFQIRHDAMPALLGRLEPTHPHNPALIALGAPRQSPGVWIGKDGHHRYKNLHAVWLFEAMPSCSPSPTAELDSVLALNPTIAAELPSPLLRVPHMRERDGKMERTDGDDLDQLAWR